MAAEGGKESYKFSAKSFQKSSYESKRLLPLYNKNIYGTEELFELVELSEVPLDHDLFKVVSI